MYDNEIKVLREYEPVNPINNYSDRIKQKEKIDKVLNALSDMVNPYGFRARGFIESIKKDPVAYETLIQLSYEWVLVYAEYGREIMDRRNEDNVMLCEDIVRETDIKDRKEVKLFPMLKEELHTVHRTLQQNMGNIFMNVLKEYDTEIKKMLDKRYGEKDMRFPLV